MPARLFDRLSVQSGGRPANATSPADTRRVRRLAALVGIAQVALVASLFAVGAFAAGAVGAPSAADASCNGWPSSGGVPPTGHHYYDYSSGSSVWSDGPMKVSLPTSYTCSGWIRTYSYNAVQTLTHAHYYWMRMMTAAGGTTNCNYAGSGTDYMRQDGCGTASFPMASGAGLSQNTAYTNFGIAYASCSTDYGAHVGWTSSSSPGANCGSPAERTPDGTSPKFDWTDPSSPALAITPGANSSLNGTTLFVKGSVAGSFTSTASGGTDSGGSGLAGYMHTLSGSTAGWSPASSLTASQVFSWSGLADGQSATLSVISRDVAGNGSAAVTRTLVADDSGPTLSASAPSAFSTASSVTVTMAAGDAGSGVGNYALYRYSAPPSGQGTCPVPSSGAPWTFYGAVTTGGAGSFTGRTFTDSGLSDGTCYYWSFQANDAVANWAGVSTGAVLVDLTRPSVATLRLQSGSDTGSSNTDNLTNASSLVYDLAFSESVTGVTSSDISLSGTATSCTVGSPAGSGTTYTVTLTGCSGGTVTLTFAANGATDVASNTGPASVVSAATVTVDRTAPTASFSTVPVTPTGATTLGYGVTFSEPVTGLTASDFSITGTATGWTVSPTITGSGTGPYTLSLAGGGEGTIIVTLASGTVTDAAGNAGPASGVAAATVTVDRAAPSVTTLHLQPGSDTGTSSTDNLTNAGSLVYDLVFSESVTGVSAADLSISGTATGCSVGAPSGSGATYAVTLTGCSEGTVILSFAANGATDVATNSGPASAVSAPTVTVDRTAPTARFSTGPTTPTGAATLDYDVTFSEPVTGLAAPDFAVTGTATGWTAGAPTGSGSGPYTLSLTGGGEGTVILTLAAGSVADIAGNAGPSSPLAAPAVTVDRTAPTVTTLRLQAGSDTGASSSDGITNAPSLVYDLAFSEPVTGVAASDLSVTGTATGCVVGAPSGSGSAYTVTLTGCSEGTVALAFAAAGADDLAGNHGPASAASAPTVTVDRTAPAVQAFTAPASPTDATSLAYTLAFSEGMYGLGASGFSVGGTATGWSVSEVSGGPASYTVTLSGVATTEGTVTLSLAAGAVIDAAGNAGPSSASSAPAVTVDRTAPAVTSFTGPASPTSSTSLAFTLTFNEGVSGLASSDFTVSGTASGWSVSAVDGPDASGLYTVTLAGSGDGTVVLSLSAGAVADLASNAGPEAAVSAPPVSVDRNPPEVTSFTAAATSTAATSLAYSLTFSSPVSGLAPSDFAVGGSSTGWTIESDISGNGAGPYTVTLTGGGEGTVTLTLAAGSVTDDPGKSGPTGPAGAPTVTVDRTGPQISAITGPASPTAATALSYSLSFSEAVTGLAAGDLTIGGTATGWAVSGLSGSGVGPYTVELVGGSTGTVTLTLAAASVADAAGNTGPVSAAAADAVTIAAPSGAPSTPAMTASSDSGSSSSDNLTNVTTPTFTGRAVQATAAIMLLDHGVVIGNGTAVGGIWTITVDTLAEGGHSIYAVETDDGQPPSPPSPALAVTVDTTPPTVQPQSPVGGTTQGIGATSFDVTWTATDSASQIVGATVARDSRPLASGSCSGSWSQDHAAQDGTSPYHDTGLALSSCYRWRVAAVDAAGNSSTTTTGTVTLGDVALASPAWGDPVFSVETVAAVAAASGGIAHVDFIADGAPVGSATSAPFSASWDTTPASAGVHTLQARLVRGDGSSELSPALVVTVDNGLPSAQRVALDQARERLSASKSALYRVLASADQGLLPARYQSPAVESGTDSVSVLSAAEYAQLNATDKATVDDIHADDLRGLAKDHEALTVVGRPDAYYTECTHTWWPEGKGPTYYCVHSVPGFKIVYWLDNGTSLPDGRATGGVKADNPSADDQVNENVNADGSLQAGADHIPDTVNTVTAALEFAQARYSYSMGYRVPQGTQYVILRPDVPCGGDGCTEKYPWTGAPEISLRDKIGLPQDPAHPNWNAWWTPRHEYFHAVQDQYNVPWEACKPEFCRDDENSVWAEGTAEWAAHQVDENSLPAQRDQNHSYSQMLLAYMSQTNLAFNDMDFATQRQYGLFILASYLEEKHGVEAVRRTWERMASGRSALDAIGMEDGGGLNSVLGSFAVAADTMSFGDPDNRFPQPPATPDNYSWVGRLKATGYRPARIPASPVTLATATPRTLTSIPTVQALNPELRDLGSGGFSLTDITPADTSAGILQVTISGPFGSVSPLGAALVAMDGGSGAACAASTVVGGTASLSLAVGNCRTVTLVMWNPDHFVNSVTVTATFVTGTLFDAEFSGTSTGSVSGFHTVSRSAGVLSESGGTMAYTILQDWPGMAGFDTAPTPVVPTGDFVLTTRLRNGMTNSGSTDTGFMILGFTGAPSTADACFTIWSHGSNANVPAWTNKQTLQFCDGTSADDVVVGDVGQWLNIEWTWAPSRNVSEFRVWHDGETRPTTPTTSTTTAGKTVGPLQMTLEGGGGYSYAYGTQEIDYVRVSQ